MPLDLNCPKCQHVFPVTEARHPIGVECPKCDAELTAEFLKLTSPEPGQPPYELLVTAGHPNHGPLPLPGGKKLLTDEEKEERGGGSMAVVIFAGLAALLVALGGLGATGYFLFTNLDTSDSTIGTINNKSNNKTNQPNPRTGQRADAGPDFVINPPKFEAPKFETPKFEPPKFEPPKTDFDLRPVPGARQAITPPPIDLSSPVTLNLPGRVEAATVGGNGRYIIFHIQAKQELTVFDASKGTLVATVGIQDGGPIKLAGGQNRVVTSDFGGRTLRSYTLPELTKEFDFTSPLPHAATAIAMGSETNSPLLIVDPFFDVALMELTNTGAKLVEGSKTEQQLKRLGQSVHFVQAAPNGRFFLFTSEPAGGKTGMLTEQGRKWNVKEIDVSSPSITTDSRYVLGNGFATDVRVSRTVRAVGNWFVAATSGRHHLRLKETRENGRQVVSFTAHSVPPTFERDPNPLLIGALPEAEGLLEGLRNNPLTLDKQVYLFSEAKLLVVMPTSRDKLVLRKIDLR